MNALCIQKYTVTIFIIGRIKLNGKYKNKHNKTKNKMVSIKIKM